MKIVLVISALLLSGCASISNMSSKNSLSHDLGYPILASDSETVINDLTHSMISHVGMEDLLVMPESNAPAALELAKQLQAMGYPIGYDSELLGDAAGHQVQLIINDFDTGFYARLAIGEIYSASRVYDATSGTLEPVSPLTVLSNSSSPRKMDGYNEPS